MVLMSNSLSKNTVMKKTVMIIMSFVLMTACVDSLNDWNVDQKQASAVPPATLFANAIKDITDALTTPNVNINNYRMFVQHWATTTYLDEPRYSMTSRLYSLNLWNAMYRDALSDLNESKRLVTLDVSLVPAMKNNQLGMIGIMEVFAWQILVNTFGGVPYSEALNANIYQPKYDDAATIYADLLTRLDASIALLTPGEASFGTSDLLYSGNAGNWVKFGNSLKLRMAMLLADVNNEKAKSAVEQAASTLDKLIQANSENARLKYINAPPNNNPISANLNPLFSSREDFVVANTLVDAMNTVNDPRRAAYFTQVGGAYIGGRYGFANTYADFSHVPPNITDPTFEGLLLDYSEVEFLLAEAIERGFTVPGTAATHYANGVTASITYWGGTGTAATTYLGQPQVAYATAAGNYKEKIGNQKWIALYNRGWDAWVEWRKLDFPALLPPTDLSIPEPLVIPVRMIYPTNEKQLNGSRYDDAKAALGGEDTHKIKLFWDVN
jgi:hypothetical protein